jgi:c-di-AMP phosphodiesterase-like protein
MEMLGGGGHQTMAATQLSCCDYNKIKQMLKEAIDKYILDCMSV